VITTRGIRIVAPALKNKELTVLNIQHSEIVKVVVHFSKQLHIIFLYTKPSCARFIAEQLQMSQSNDKCKFSSIYWIKVTTSTTFYFFSAAPYFSPISRSEPQKKIVCLAESINEETRSIIKSIYSRSVLEEINNRDANEMLVRSTGIPLVAPAPTSTQNAAPNESK
jgi:hypothetical protein